MNNSVILVRWGRRLAILTLVIAGGYVGGSTAGRIVAHSLRVDPAFAPESQPPSEARAPVVRLAAIAERNLFAARRETVVSGPGGGPWSDARACADARVGDARACSAWQLRGTIVGDRPAWSAAVIFETISKRTRVVTVGAAGDDTEVCEIRPGALLLRRGEHFELCVANVAPEPTLAGLQSSTTGVHRLASGEYEVTRAELDRLRADPHSVLGDVRLVPARGGFKAFKIKPGSIFARLGLKNGDVLTAVNGRALATPGELIGLYGELETIEEVVVDLTRRGRAETLRYRIVE